MLKNPKNLLQLLKAMKAPGHNDIKSSLNLDYAVEEIWHRIVQKIQANAQNEKNQTLKEFQIQLEESTNQPETEIIKTTDDVWVFGYGSLIWKADFPYIDRRKGFIRGYQRLFYQQSIDHRGTTAQPGRVVTLLPTNNKADRVYGVAYRIAKEQKDDVLQHLDYREKNGYERRKLEFQVYPEKLNERFDLIMYIATKENNSYAGHICHLEDIAKQIFISAGPSGPNREYLFNLANAMRALFPDVEDVHLFELEAVVLNLIDQNETKLLKEALKNEIIKIINGDDLTDEQAKKKIENILSIYHQRGGKETLLRQVMQLN